MWPERKKPNNGCLSGVKGLSGGAGLFLKDLPFPLSRKVV